MDAPLFTLHFKENFKVYVILIINTKAVFFPQGSLLFKGLSPSSLAGPDQPSCPSHALHQHQPPRLYLLDHAYILHHPAFSGPDAFVLVDFLACYLLSSSLPGRLLRIDQTLATDAKGDRTGHIWWLWPQRTDGFCPGVTIRSPSP